MKKMVMAVISRDQAEAVLESLIAEGHTATYTDSRGGMLRQAQQMLFIAVEEEDLEKILGIIRENCHTSIEVEPQTNEFGRAVTRRRTSAQLGGAVIFVWDLEQFAVY